MSDCPLDRAPCTDPRCLKGGCQESNGEPMLLRCRGCRAMFNEDAADDGLCPECAERQGKVQIGALDI